MSDILLPRTEQHEQPVVVQFGHNSENVAVITTSTCVLTLEGAKALHKHLGLAIADVEKLQAVKQAVIIGNGQ
jgi:hypothetical protein